MNSANQTLSVVLAAAFADRCRPFDPIVLTGGQALDRGPGIIELIPDAQAKTAPTIISAGIHGNETAPLELLFGLASELDAGGLAIAAPTLLIIGHPASIPAGQRYLDTNLNRLFRRDAESPPVDTREHARAGELMAAVDAFWAAQRPSLPSVDADSRDVALHLDLHTAIRASQYPRFVVEPFSDVVTPASLWQTLAGCDLQAVLTQHQPSWTFSHYSRHYHRVVAFTLELGKVAAFGANDLKPLAGIQAWLADRVAGRVSRQAPATQLRYFRVIQELMRDSDEFALAFDEALPNFTEFAVGETIATDATAGDTVVADAPIYVVFPNAQVEKGARAALLVRPENTAI